VIRTPDSRRIGFVFQHPHHQIFERTVARELRLDHPLSDAELGERLAASRLAGLADAAPLSLSLGEQRRLTLMTALADEPDLLLLDEPFIGQDRHNVLWILSRIEQVRARGGTTVVVSHDTGLLAAIADRLLFVDGETALFGRPAEVFQRLADWGRTAYVPEREVTR
jgi:energy-coupling factor transport system ATP-binding protein